MLSRTAEVVALGTVESVPPPRRDATERRDVELLRTDIATLVQQLRESAARAPWQPPGGLLRCADAPYDEDGAPPHPACRHGATDECAWSCFDQGNVASCAALAEAAAPGDETLRRAAGRRAGLPGHGCGR